MPNARRLSPGDKFYAHDEILTVTKVDKRMVYVATDGAPRAIRKREFYRLIREGVFWPVEDPPAVTDS